MEGMSDNRNEIEQRLGVFARPGTKAEMGNPTSYERVINVKRDCQRWYEVQNQRINSYSAILQRKYANDPVLTEVMSYFKAMKQFVDAAYAKMPSSSGPQDVDNYLLRLREFYNTLKTRGQTVIDDGFKKIHYLINAADQKKRSARPGAKDTFSEKAEDNADWVEGMIYRYTMMFSPRNPKGTMRFGDIAETLKSWLRSLSDKQKKTIKKKVVLQALESVKKYENGDEAARVLRSALTKATASRPGAKTKMGILDRISRGLSAATAKPVDPTTPQYASGLNAAKKAAEDAKSNYDYMADLNDARFKQLDNYVKVTSSMIAKMNSTADIQRLIAGLKAAVAARVFVQSSMKTPFSRSQAKTVFEYRMSDADRELNTQIKNALSKIVKLSDACQDLEKILRRAADDNRNNEKGNQFKALKVEAHWLADKINDLAVEASQLGQYKYRIKTTEELRAEVAKAQDLLRKLVPLNQKADMIRRNAQKVEKSGSFSRLGEKTEFVSQSRQLYTEYKKQINKAFKAAERLQGLASDFEWNLKDKQSAAKKQKKNDKANQFAALIKELNSLLRDMDNVSMDASGLGMEYGQSFDDMKADADKSQDIVRKTAILAAKFDAIKRKASEVQKMNSARITASRPGAKATAAKPEIDDTEQDKAGLKLMEKADKAVSDKIRTLIKEGKPQDQAVAIALDMKRRGEL